MPYGDGASGMMMESAGLFNFGGGQGQAAGGAAGMLMGGGVGGAGLGQGYGEQFDFDEWMAGLGVNMNEGQ